MGREDAPWGPQRRRAGAGRPAQRDLSAPETSARLSGLEKTLLSDLISSSLNTLHCKPSWKNTTAETATLKLLRLSSASKPAACSHGACGAGAWRAPEAGVLAHQASAGRQTCGPVKIRESPIALEYAAKVTAPKKPSEPPRLSLRLSPG